MAGVEWEASCTQMRLVLEHPIGVALAFEVLLVTLWCLFPVGACNQPLVGVMVVVIHYPAILILEHAFGLRFSVAQYAASAFLMIPAWAALLYLLRMLIVAVERRSNTQGSD